MLRRWSGTTESGASDRLRLSSKKAMMVTNAAGSREGAVQVAIAALGPAALILACVVTVLGAGWMLAPLLAG